MQQLNSRNNPIDFKTRFERAYRYQQDEMTESDKKDLEKEEEALIQEKLKLAERIKIDFFNHGALSLIRRSKSPRFVTTLCSSEPDFVRTGCASLHRQSGCASRQDNGGGTVRSRVGERQGHQPRRGALLPYNCQSV